ncbi:2-amino-4-hydroxy-6-hydroxymethyldihydropteridine diphosphokinase [Gulbenkiania mobilis]|uniref:2-amino-4-hydroxy-6-hydroxymethyldihydropteridine pyrophosphokinase n=1 Tax=Gulbenkiania mobilis TaxID=397457 RepID=A0ABY2CYH6_GULMO|nr:2-amino-4-hydroxy-6-hydroxymethyldihydropteridine diphosphokinase [Gulbenkiania mobilis]TCW30352.1 2-amino-4-hydroxy-6-hydroxymethyldihydropteridine diphosphokinase [Gulbenkiania mobilis]
MTRAYVALGSNLEQPEQQIRAALAALDTLEGVRLVRASALYRTRPVGYLDQPDFINAVAEVETVLSASDLLSALLALETRFGRVRSFRNAPRVLDLDLLLYDGCEQAGPTLTLPHPRMHERAFVMVPLAELAPDRAVGSHGTVAALAATLATPDIERLAEA